MADIPHSFLGLLVTVLYLLTGVSGETLSMFSRVGDNVSLPCNNVVYPDCSSTTWIYNRALSTRTIQEVTLGKIKVVQTERAERLSLGSYCSLHVSDVRAEDVGLYICRQFLTDTGPQHGGDAPVHLSVLTNIAEKTTDSDDVISTLPGSTASTAKPAFSATSPSSAGTSNAVKLPISHIMLFVTLTIMAAIVTIHTRRIRPPKALPPQAEEASGIEIHVLEE
ncbi:uncharacterized protein LOC115118581 isoform X1 [Oncorhynchus nerka]|uniref:uncharacterized protein LOC115118581 isoform X1 n=1 Tax=Oncorhynchus nerka TaxID=8023 RepID=UPI0031B82A3E